MQIQNSSQDCGLFAIPIATALLNGLHMSQMTFCQDDETTPDFLLHNQINNSIVSTN